MTGCLLWPPKRKVSFQQISKSGPVNDHTGKQNEILKLGAAGEGPGRWGHICSGEVKEESIGLLRSSGSQRGGPRKGGGGPQKGEGPPERRGTTRKGGTPQEKEGPPERRVGEQEAEARGQEEQAREQRP